MRKNSFQDISDTKNKDKKTDRSPNNRYKNAIIAGTVIVFWFFILILSFKVQLISDDWHFKFIFKSYMPGEEEQKIESLSNVFQSMQTFYLTSGGRVMAHSILQIILMADKLIFNLLNATIFALVGFLVYRVSEICKEEKKYLLAVTYILMIILLPSFGDSCLWVSGAVNYLWMSLMYILFFFFDRKENVTGKLIFAFLSGMANEPVGGMICVYILAKAVISGKKVRILDIFCMILTAAGSAFILLAPGNGVRAEVVSRTEMFTVNAVLTCIGKTLAWFVTDFYYIPVIICIVISCVFRKRIKEYAFELALLVAAVAGAGALTLSGKFIERSEFPCVIMLIMAFLGFVRKGKQMYNELEENSRIKSLTKHHMAAFIKKVVIVAAAFVLIIMFAINMTLFVKISDDEKSQMNQIEKAAEAGEKAEISLLSYSNTGFYPKEVSVSNEYEALWKALYYGIDIDWK